jgi:hypothetical protein
MDIRLRFIRSTIIRLRAKSYLVWFTLTDFRHWLHVMNLLETRNGLTFAGAAEGVVK